MSRAEFELVVGLEVHAQLLTHSKLFAAAPTAFGGVPNAHTTPVCLGMPGALPVVNSKAVEFAVTAGLALGCQINERSVWARKHYFYPDLPKGYQISQYEQPLCEHGHLEFDGPAGPERVRIRRIHMEEDAGKSTHDAVDGASLVDLNRAGTPLVEIVSEPDLRRAASAAEYLRVLRDVLVFLGVNDGNLEEGSFRCDANVSIRRVGATEFGTRTELKNINSFRFVEKAIEREFERQVELVEAGQTVVQETRLYDPDRDETRSMRTKEDAQDYRYFPDPDLPVLEVPAAKIAALRAALPELPRARAKRFVEAFELSAADAAILCADRALAALFEGACGAGATPKRAAGLIISVLLRLLNEAQGGGAGLKFSAAQFGDLVKAVDGNVISSTAAKDVLADMFATGDSPTKIIEARGLAQVSDTAEIEAAVRAVMAANASQVDAYRAGKTQVLGFFVGQVMKSMKGKANPKVVNELVTRALGGSPS